jgi:23S rRNA (pseudouridine1915-N3)-methyltransferase
VAGLNVKIIAVGKLREAWQRGACDEYLKRLRRYAPTEVVEVKDLPEPDRPNAALEQKVRLQEGREILKCVRERDFVVALYIHANAPDSLRFADMFARWAEHGKSPVFVIGGSLGLSDEVLGRADACVSLSNLTFPHALARVVLLEQIYRAARINANERYHK